MVPLLTAGGTVLMVMHNTPLLAALQHLEYEYPGAAAAQHSQQQQHRHQQKDSPETLQWKQLRVPPGVPLVYKLDIPDMQDREGDRQLQLSSEAFGVGASSSRGLVVPPLTVRTNFFLEIANPSTIQNVLMVPARL